MYGLSQVFTAVSGTGNGSGLLLILTELTGLYAISTILLIRKQLPLKYRYIPHDKAPHNTHATSMHPMPIWETGTAIN